MKMYFEHKHEHFGISYPIKWNFLSAIWIFYLNGFRLKYIWK